MITRNSGLRLDPSQMLLARLHLPPTSQPSSCFAVICFRLVNELFKETADVIVSLSSINACQSLPQPRAGGSAPEAAGNKPANEESH